MLAAIPLGIAGWTAAAVVRSYWPTPYYDQWVNVWWWRALDQGAPLWDYLFSQHNEHRILLPRLVFLADLHWLRGDNVVSLAAIGVTQVLGALLYLRMALRRRQSWLTALAATVAVSLMFLLAQWENFFCGFQLQFFGVYVAGAAAIYLFFRSTERANGLRWASLAFAALLLAAAVFSMANGLLAGPAMAIAAVLGRRSARATLAIMAATLLLAAIYLHDYHSVAGQSPPQVALQRPDQYLGYIAAYLGNLWAPGKVERAQVVGLLGVAAALAMAYIVRRSERADSERLTLLAIVLFVGMSAGLTAFGRLSFGMGQAMASRYTTPTAHFWAALAVFWALTATQTRARIAKGAMAGALILMLATLVPLQQAGERELVRLREQLLVGSAALLSNVPDAEALEGVYPDLSLLIDLRTFLLERRLAIFAEDRDDYTVGTRFARPAAPLGREGCLGSFDLVRSNPRQPALARAFGWGWDTPSKRAFRRIVLTDGTGAVIGVGLSGLERRDVPRVMADVRSIRSGWEAPIVRPSTGEITAYGVMRNGRACELGKKPWPQ